MCVTYLICIKHYLADPLLMKVITALVEQLVSMERGGVNT
jgi:hypothetical protein